MRRPWDGVDIIHRPKVVKTRVIPSDSASTLKSAEVRALLLITEMMCLQREFTLDNRQEIHKKLKSTAATLRMVLEKEKAKVDSRTVFPAEEAGKGPLRWLELLREKSEGLGKGTEQERRARLGELDCILTDTFEYLGS